MPQEVHGSCVVETCVLVKPFDVVVLADGEVDIIEVVRL